MPRSLSIQFSCDEKRVRDDDNNNNDIYIKESAWAENSPLRSVFTSAALFILAFIFMHNGRDAHFAQI